MRTYHGCWGEDGPIAYVKDEGTIASLRMGFGAPVEWGRSSRGTELLARAILERASLEAEAVDRLLPAFVDLLAGMPRAGFTLSEQELRAWVLQQDRSPRD